MTTPQEHVAGSVSGDAKEKRKRLNSALVAGLSAVLTVAVVGCGGTGSTGNSASTGGNSATTSNNSGASGASSSGSGTITDGLFEEPGNLNPILGPNMTYSQIVDQALYANLYTVNPKGDLVPEMATEVPTLDNGGISKDGLTYTFHLNPNAKWSNGDPFTSKDVETTFKIITNPAVNSVSKLGWSDVSSIQIIDDHTFEVHLKRVSPGFVKNAFSSSLPAILPYSVFGKMNPKDINTAAFNHAPTVTNGPYKFVKWVPGASIQVTANPYWAGPKPKTQNIDFKIIPDQNTLLTSAKAQAINVWYFDPITALDQIKQIPNATAHLTPQPAYEMGVINMRNPILQDVNVRKALELAINRQAIVDQIYKGNALLLAADQSKMSWTSNPNLQPYPYDPTQAKQLLDAAGWKMGPNGYRQKNGQTLKLIYSTTAGNSTREATERLIQYWWKQVGIDMVIKNVPASDFFGNMLPSGQGWDIGEYESSDGADPPANTEQHFASTGSSNYGAFHNTEVDKLIQEANSTVDQTKRQQLMQQVEQILHDQLPALWYYAPDELDTSIGITGYVPNPWGVDTWNVYDWQLSK